MGAFLKICASTVLILCALPATGAEMTITLDNPGAVACNQSWTEGGCPIHLAETLAEDCHTPGICFFNGDLYPGGLYFPYRMIVDLSNLRGVDSIEVDVYDGWEIGCVQAWLYSGTLLLDHQASGSVGSWITMVFPTGGIEVTRLIISGWDGAIDEIRIAGDDLTAVDDLAWSALKALY